MKYMILLYHNADMREIFRPGDLMEEMAGLLEEIRQSGELVATEPLADPVQTKTVRPADGPPVVTDGPLAEAKDTAGSPMPWHASSPSNESDRTRPASRDALDRVKASEGALT